MTLFQKKQIILNSGKSSDFKIECDALTDEDIETIAYLISKKFKFGFIWSIPTGGDRLGKALVKYMSDSQNMIMIDDVLTTGGSFKREKKIAKSQGFSKIKGVVIFARGKCPSWITPIFKMTDFK